ncbi:MAG: ABC transporter permease [Treponema sp.]|jgi:putative ABC transport system permease protein|nr:ABC transporter permease [Treponema sp.]
MKNKRFFVRMLFKAFFLQRGRMGTALLAMTLGAAVLSGLVTLSRDIPRQLGREFRSYGANLVLVPAGNRGFFTRADLRRAGALLPQGALLGVTPWRYRQVKVNEQPLMAAGTDFAAVRHTSPYWLVHGSLPRERDEALLGEEAARLLRLAPGGVFAIGSRAFTVAGTLGTGGAEEGFILLTLEGFAALESASLDGAAGEDAAEGGRFDAAECSLTLGPADLDAAAARVNAAALGLEARPVKRLAVSEGAVLAKLSALILLVTVIVLLLVLICTATTMLAIAAERRREIGLRKALGASGRDLALEFFCEGGLLGLTGGLLGSIAGFVFAQQIALRVFGRPLAFAALTAPLTALACLALALAASAFPVRSAAQVEPAIVLRGE